MKHRRHCPFNLHFFYFSKKKKTPKQTELFRTPLSLCRELYSKNSVCQYVFEKKFFLSVIMHCRQTQIAFVVHSSQKHFYFASAPTSIMYAPICAPNSGAPSMMSLPSLTDASISSMDMRIPSAESRLLKRIVKNGIALL